MSSEEKREFHGVVYLIRCKINGKGYVGITQRTIKDRHCKLGYLKNKHHQTFLANAVRKHGSENFEISTLEEGWYENRKVLSARETYFIQTLNTLVPNGYNIVLHEYGPDFGPAWRSLMKTKNSRLEVRKRVSLGTKLSWKDPEIRQRRIEGIRLAFNKPESKERRSLAGKRSHNQVEVRMRQSISAKLAHQRSDVKERFKLATKQAQNRPEVREKIAKVQKEQRKLKLQLLTQDFILGCLERSS